MLPCASLWQSTQTLSEGMPMKLPSSAKLWQSSQDIAAASACTWWLKESGCSWRP